MEYVSVYSSTGDAADHDADALAFVRAKFSTESGMAFSNSLASSGNGVALMVGLDDSVVFEAPCEVPCAVCCEAESLFSAQPGQMNADTNASTITKAAATTATTSLP